MMDALLVIRMITISSVSHVKKVFMQPTMVLDALLVKRINSITKMSVLTVLLTSLIVNPVSNTHI